MSNNNDTTKQEFVHPRNQKKIFNTKVQPEELYHSMCQHIKDSNDEDGKLKINFMKRVMEGDQIGSTYQAVPSNSFFKDSRYIYEKPDHPRYAYCTAKITCCGSSVAIVKPSIATIKCFTCQKFDTAERMGYYCDGCFKIRHPYYRTEHRWITIDQADDFRFEKEHLIYRTEIDRLRNRCDQTRAIVVKNKEIMIEEEDKLKGIENIFQCAKKLKDSKHRIEVMRRMNHRDMLVKNLAYDDMSSMEKLKAGEDGILIRDKNAAIEIMHYQLLVKYCIMIQAGIRRLLTKKRLKSIVSSKYAKRWKKSVGAWQYINMYNKSKSYHRPPHIRTLADENAILSPKSYELTYGKNAKQKKFVSEFTIVKKDKFAMAMAMANAK